MSLRGVLVILKQEASFIDMSLTIMGSPEYPTKYDLLEDHSKLSPSMEKLPFNSSGILAKTEQTSSFKSKLACLKCLSFQLLTQGDNTVLNCKITREFIELFSLADLVLEKRLASTESRRSSRVSDGKFSASRRLLRFCSLLGFYFTNWMMRVSIQYDLILNSNGIWEI